MREGRPSSRGAVWAPVALGVECTAGAGQEWPVASGRGWTLQPVDRSQEAHTPGCSQPPGAGCAT